MRLLTVSLEDTKTVISNHKVSHTYFRMHFGNRQVKIIIHLINWLILDSECGWDGSC